MLPVFTTVYLCDDFVPIPGSSKWAEFGLLDAFRPAEAEPPFILEKLCVFTQVTDWEGPLEMRVEVARRDTLDVVAESLVRFQVRSRTAVVHVPIRLTSVTFDHYGDFLIGLHCNGEFIQDRVLRVLGPGGG